MNALHVQYQDGQWLKRDAPETCPTCGGQGLVWTPVGAFACPSCEAPWPEPEVEELDELVGNAA